MLAGGAGKRSMRQVLNTGACTVAVFWTCQCPHYGGQQRTEERSMAKGELKPTKKT